MHFAAIMHFREVHDRREVHDQRGWGRPMFGERLRVRPGTMEA
jgi:hypothetical protein